jgi:rhodanese-related sulfurtransferase
MRNNKWFLWICYFLIACNGNGHAQKTAQLLSAAFEQKMKEGAQVLDVRTAEEYKQSHIANALQADWLNQIQFKERIQHLDKTKPVLVYCASGVRSKQAMQWMSKEGFLEVYNLREGLSIWKMEGKPVIKDAGKVQMLVDDFEKEINLNKRVLVDVGAAWCPPCKKMEPLVEKLSKDYGDQPFELLKVDGGNDIEVMKHIKATVLPTFIFFKNGKEISRKEGIISYNELKRMIQ